MIYFIISSAYIHVVLQIRKCHLRLYHPEFRRMSCRIEFSALKVGPKVYTSLKARANVSASSCPLTVSPASLPKKIVAVIHISLCRLRGFSISRVVTFKHFSGAFTVAGSNYRRMHIYESSFLEKFVYGICRKEISP